MPVYAEFKPAFQATNPLEYANRVQQQSVNAFQRAQHLRLQEEQNQRAYRQLELQEQQLELQKNRFDAEEERAKVTNEAESLKLENLRKSQAGWVDFHKGAMAEADKFIEDFKNDQMDASSDLSDPWNLAGARKASKEGGEFISPLARNKLMQYQSRYAMFRKRYGQLQTNPLFANEYIQKLGEIDSVMTPDVENLKLLDARDYRTFMMEKARIAGLPLKNQKQLIANLEANSVYLLKDPQYNPLVTSALTDLRKEYEAEVERQNKLDVEERKRKNQLADRDEKREYEREEDEREANSPGKLMEKIEFRTSVDKQVAAYNEGGRFLKIIEGIDTTSVSGIKGRLSAIAAKFLGRNPDQFHVDRIGTDEWLKGIQKMKGAISDREGAILMSKIPQRGDDNEVFQAFFDELVEVVNADRSRIYNTVNEVAPDRLSELGGKPGGGSQSQSQQDLQSLQLP